MASLSAVDGPAARLHRILHAVVIGTTQAKGAPTSDYDERPWLALYGDQPPDREIEFGDALSRFRAGVVRDPSAVALRYFDGVLTRWGRSRAASCADDLGRRRSAAEHGVRQARPMTTPAPEDPQPRDIALEQATPELEADLEAQSGPESAGASEES